MQGVPDEPVGQAHRHRTGTQPGLDLVHRLGPAGQHCDVGQQGGQLRRVARAEHPGRDDLDRGRIRLLPGVGDLGRSERGRALRDLGGGEL